MMQVKTSATGLAKVVLLFGGLAAVTTWFTDRAARFDGSDATLYWKMAHGHVAPAPFGYRILVPGP